MLTDFSDIYSGTCLFNVFGSSVSETHPVEIMKNLSR